MLKQALKSLTVVISLVFIVGIGAQAQSLTGAGATFPAPIYQKWFQEYAASTGVQINYQAIGSGGGIKNITAHAVDFGASDAPMSAAELAAAPGILHIPTVAGAVVIAYNVAGLGPGVHFTPSVIADIFLGKITKWNDPAITRLNPGVAFPGTGITPFHRSDGSGTTNIFTNYLAQVSGDWAGSVGAGKSVRWPKGLGGKGNPGVAALIKQTDGGIGYIELAYAIQNHIYYGAVRNSHGNYIYPDIKSTVAAAEGSTLPADFRKVIVNTSAAQGYPITGFTFLLVYHNSKPELISFLKWMLTTGQGEAESLLYAPLPANVQHRAMLVVDSLR